MEEPSEAEKDCKTSVPWGALEYWMWDSSTLKLAEGTGTAAVVDSH